MQTVRPAAPAIRCLACGQPLDVSAETCIACGRVLPPHASAGRHAVTAARPYESFGRPRIQVQSGTHSVTLAILLGFFMTGTGQMANKQLAKGITLLIAAVLLAVPTIGMGAVIVWLVAFIDAICVANRLNRGEPITEWTWF
jgi:TM2 domain-containing membrane protein YozV